MTRPDHDPNCSTCKAEAQAESERYKPGGFVTNPAGAPLVQAMRYPGETIITIEQARAGLTWVLHAGEH